MIKQTQLYSSESLNGLLHHSQCQVTRSWGKDSDFIWKARKLIRWGTRVLRDHLEKGRNSWFFCVRGKGSGRGLRSEVADDRGLLDVNKCQWDHHGKGLFSFQSTNYSCHGPNHEVPLINNNYFCTYLSYLLGEVVLSREVTQLFLGYR